MRIEVVELMRLQKDLKKSIDQLMAHTEATSNVHARELARAFAVECSALDEALDRITLVALDHEESLGSA